MKSIATLGSHCALQLLKGAKDAGFRSVIIVKKEHEKFYRRFRFIDRYLVVNKFSDITTRAISDKLAAEDSVLIPHGTLISEVGIDLVEEKVKIPIFGNRRILRWEADRQFKERLLQKAGFRTPMTLHSPDEIDRLVIVKLPGAAGGRGYFLAYDRRSFRKNLREFTKKGLLRKQDEDRLHIQEYTAGVPVYIHFFYSPLRKEVELFGIDRRYESEVDAIGRIPASIQMKAEINPSYRVVGNIPLVLRESLLEELYSLAESFVETSKKLVPPGMIGPFCLEGVYEGSGGFKCFEFSARIVAGTNLFMQGSPYTALTYDQPMSMGRRIALELREGKETDQLKELLT